MLLFAAEYQWTPATVWALTLSEFCVFADHLDALQKARKAKGRKR